MQKYKSVKESLCYISMTAPGTFSDAGAWQSAHSTMWGQSQLSAGGTGPVLHGFHHTQQ